MTLGIVAQIASLVVLSGAKEVIKIWETLLPLLFHKLLGQMQKEKRCLAKAQYVWISFPDQLRYPCGTKLLHVFSMTNTSYELFYEQFSGQV